ncbi:hypothetical protein Tco_1566220, partial [Tanacetum coccineum]
DCDFHEKRVHKESILGKGTGHREVRPVWNNTQRINHQNKFVPTAVLTRSGRIPVSTAKQYVNTAKQYVNTATPKNRVNVLKSTTNGFYKSHSPIRRPFYKLTVLNTRVSKEKVNVVRVNGVNIAGQTVVSSVKGNGVTTVKASAGNKALLTDYQDIDGGFVASGGNTRGGKITEGKATQSLLQDQTCELYQPTITDVAYGLIWTNICKEYQPKDLLSCND